MRFVAGPGMGYGAHIAPFLWHAEATVMRATCVQMCYAIERIFAWPTPVAATALLLGGNHIGAIGAAAIGQVLRCAINRRARRTGRGWVDVT